MTQYKAVASHALRASAATLALTLMACAAKPKSDGGPAATDPVPARPMSTAPAAAEPVSQPYESVAAAREAAPQLRDTAPLRYVVKPGDTLWDISQRYLADSWQWPEIWYVNGKLANPHRIYPGDVLELHNVNGRAVVARSEDLERLTPRVRPLGLGEGLQAIPIDAIRHFLKGPRAVDLDTLNRAPYILAFADEHLIGGADMDVFVKKLPETADTAFSIVRKGVAYKDPDTGELLGYEAIPSGELEVRHFGDPADGRITSSVQEVLTGDRLLPPEAENFQANFYPRAPAGPVGGKIISVYNGVTNIGQYQIVALNRGGKHGLEPGHVLDIRQASRTVKDPVTGKKTKLPEQDAGVLMVFKTMQGISYGLVMEATRAVHVLDHVEKPGLDGK